ncbi:MAG: hypothetical protein V9E98_04270 [Candidatus Nanopelagicales bacterium]
MVPSERTVTVAVGHGKQAARNIDGWLRGEQFVHARAAAAGDLRHAEHLVLHRRAQDRAARRWTSPAALSTFDEVKQGLDESTALFEARRCLSCGNCFGCDNCFGVCPDNAVLQTAARLRGRRQRPRLRVRPRLLQRLRDLCPPNAPRARS